jgi:drug/metabolite transporter (DMT)-like permease
LTPLVLALGASLAWGIADFAGPLLSRTLGTLRVLFWAQVGGVAALAVALLVRADAPHGWGVVYAAAAAVGGIAGLYAYYRGMQLGQMSVVAPIAGISAVIPVTLGFLSGDNPSAAQVAGIACAIVGVGFASVEHQEEGRRVATGVGLALLAALGFGLYFPFMHAAGKVDFWWASFVFRSTALVLVAGAATAVRPVLRLSRRDLAIAAAVGIGDTIGNVLFAASSAHGLVSLTSVLASLYPIVTVLLAAAILKERVAGLQRAGVALTLAGVVLIGS